jgi:hypothetical protein
MGRRFIVAAPVERSLAALYTRTEDYLDRGLGGIVVGVGGRHPLLDRPDGTLDVDAAFRYVEFVRDADPRVAIAVDAEGGSIFNVLEGISPLASRGPTRKPLRAGSGCDRTQRPTRGFSPTSG